MTQTTAATTLRDYVAWHQAYDDPTSDLSRRLRAVQGAITSWLDRTPGGVRVLSVCAGQGHDILGVLTERPGDRRRVNGTLVEIDPTNAAVARRRIESMKLHFNVVVADAGASDTYREMPRADLVLLAGIMGNLAVEDIERLVRTAPQWLRPGGTVLWTRGDQEPDLGDEIRGWFADAGFEEVSFETRVNGSPMAVGVQRLVGEPAELVAGQRIFTFIR